MIDYLNSLPISLIIIIKTLFIYFGCILLLFLLFRISVKSTPSKKSTRAQTRSRIDFILLFSSVILFIVAPFIFPKVSPFRWQHFLYSILGAIFGGIVDYLSSRKFPSLYLEERGSDNNLRFSLVILTALSAILYHFTNLERLGISTFQISLQYVLWLTTCGGFGLFITKILIKHGFLAKATNFKKQT